MSNLVVRIVTGRL